MLNFKEVLGKVGAFGENLRERFGRKEEPAVEETPVEAEGAPSLDTQALGGGTPADATPLVVNPEAEIPAFLQPRVEEAPTATEGEPQAAESVEPQPEVATEEIVAPKKSLLRRLAIPAVALLVIGGGAIAWLFNRNKPQVDPNKDTTPPVSKTTPDPAAQTTPTTPTVNLVPTTMKPGTIFFEGTDPATAKSIIFVDDKGVCTLHIGGREEKGNYFPDGSKVVFQGPSNTKELTLGQYDPDSSNFMLATDKNGHTYYAWKPELTSSISPAVYRQLGAINSAGAKLTVTDKEFKIDTGVPSEPKVVGEIKNVGGCTILTGRSPTGETITFYAIMNPVTDVLNLVNCGKFTNRSTLIPFEITGEEPNLTSGLDELKSMLTKSEWSCDEMGLAFSFEKDGSVTASNSFVKFRAVGKWGEGTLPDSINLAFESDIADYLDGKTVLAGVAFTIQIGNNGELIIFRPEIPSETRVLQSK